MKTFLPIAISAAEQACIEILEVYNSNDFEAELKGDNSPLTLADRRAHIIIEEALKPTGLPILSEEGKNIPYETRKNWEYFWLVDPLDGTKEFLKRNGEFTVNIALIHHGAPVLGVVSVPVSRETYFSAGEGAFVIRNGKREQLPRRKQVDFNSGGLRVVASRSHMNSETQSFINGLKDPVLVSKGSSLKFMMIAEGLADLYPRYAPTMEWDTAAAHAIVSETGASVIEFGSENELVYNKPDLLNPHFLVV